jgi:osmoprotectant transport system substrate-binding protein
MRLPRRTSLVLATIALALPLAACGGDSLEEGDGDDAGSNGETPAEDKGELVLASQDFPEGQIMTSMYALLLEDAGYSVTEKLVGTRDVYLGELSNGAVDIAPEYLGGLADFLNTEANGADAEPVTTPDVDESLDALTGLAEAKGITMLQPAEAAAANAFFVTQEFAEQNDVETLTDLGELGQPIKLAAAPDCEGRSDCEAGLREVYGIDITEVVPLGYATTQTFEAVKNGEVEVGQTGTTDGTLESQGLVFLEDDQSIQPAQNLIPAVNTEFYNEHQDVADVLNSLMEALSTDDLVELNAQVSVERQKPADAAQAYLENEGLL